jgi:hypothetical protein
VAEAGKDFDPAAWQSGFEQIQPWRGLPGLHRRALHLRIAHRGLDGEQRRAHRGERRLEHCRVPARHARPQRRAGLGALAHGARDEALGGRRRLEEHLPEKVFGPARVAALLDLGARRRLGRIRIAGAGAAAVDQHDAGDALGREPVRLEHDPAAHAVAEQNRFRKIQIRNERGNVAAVMLDRAFLRPPGRFAVAAQVAGHDFTVPGKKLELMPPILVTAQKPVHEKQRRRAAPLADEMQT